MNDALHEHATIMAVDDEPANLKLLDKLLRGQGYFNIELVGDPRDVMKRYAQKRPDLILLDINMPHLDGYQVMAQVKELADPLAPPIVILTAQHGRDGLLRALSSGARDFVPKPFDRTELLMRVRNLLDAHLAHRMLHDRKELLEDMVQARTEALNLTRLQVVQRLGRAAEYRDNETGLHIIRMSKYSALLSRSLGWSAADCDLMLHASPMHDVGKIGIPDGILLKKGSLSGPEWEIMKTHAVIGGDILDDANSDLLNLAREIALTHHEKWDGSGYPMGLSGAAIPMSGRVVAVADVFDALTSQRPYKEAWTIDACVDHIRRHSGAHFDPELVRHFEQLLPDFLAIREQFPEP